MRALSFCAPRWGHRDGALKRAIAVSNVANATLSNPGALGSWSWSRSHKRKGPLSRALLFVAGGLGFEPRLTESEYDVDPG